MLVKKIKRRFSGESLKARLLRGSAWLAVGNIAEKILAFVSRIILARLLVPEDLGVVVLISSIIGLFGCLTEVGIKQCLIQNKNGDKPEFLNMVWWFSVLRGTGLFLIAWLLAPWACRFYFEGKEQVLALYDWPTLFMMVRVTFLNSLFNGLISPRAYLMEKQFRFARVVGYMQSAAITGTILTIILSFVMRNAWAMVLGFVCQGFLRTVMSYIFCPFCPRLDYHQPSLSQLFRFGRGIWGSPFFAYIAYSIDVLVGGKVLGPELIGLYGFAVGLAYIPKDLFSRIINPVLMPVFAEQQDNHMKLRKVMGQLAGNLILITIPIIVVSFLFHKTILITIYGAKFESVSMVFAIFTLSVLAIMSNRLFINLFMAMGHPEINRNFTFMRALLLVVSTIPVAWAFGMIGLAVIQVIANYMMLVFLFIRARKMISFGFRDIYTNLYIFNGRTS